MKYNGYDSVGRDHFSDDLEEMIRWSMSDRNDVGNLAPRHHSRVGNLPVEIYQGESLILLLDWKENCRHWDPDFIKYRWDVSGVDDAELPCLVGMHPSLDVAIEERMRKLKI